MGRKSRASALLVLLAGALAASVGAESRFKQTHSRSPYVHWIDLYDANNRRIDPTDPHAPPYCPKTTCGRCHDYRAIARGHHFNAFGGSAPAGRPGEPWIWTDARTGTQIPLSYRGWHGTYDPRTLGISAWDFVLKFGHHLPGGGPGAPSSAIQASDEAGVEKADEGGSGEAKEAEEPAAEDDEARWELSGELDIDCMICHSRDHAYSPEVRWEQIESQNLGWAATAAVELADVEGEVKRLPDDFDPASADANSRYKLPQTAYRPVRMNADKKVFFDVIRKPENSACYYCHSTHLVGEGAGPEWTHDEDVHLRAGMACSDCHRNGIEHHTVRGFEGEEHPTGESVATLSCRGCHLGEHGGRLGAPKPLHKGLPPLHFDKLACTTCHSGPRPGERPLGVQTALAHGLGLPSHYAPEAPPRIVEPVFLREPVLVEGGKTRPGRLYPYRMMWPAFWGMMTDDALVPLDPDKVYDTLRRTLRLRRGTTFASALTQVRLTSQDKAKALGDQRARTPESELTDAEKAKLAELERAKGKEEFQKKMTSALEAIKKILPDPDAQPVYVSGGRAWRLAADGTLETFQNEAVERAAAPYAWRLAHDVRPARWSLGATGCTECHAPGAPLFEGKVAAAGPAPDEAPVTKAMYELAGFDKVKLDAWNRSFAGRPAFKWLALVSAATVGLILLAYLLLGFNGLAGLVRRR